MLAVVPYAVTLRLPKEPEILWGRYQQLVASFRLYRKYLRPLRGDLRDARNELLRRALQCGTMDQ